MIYCGQQLQLVKEKKALEQVEKEFYVRRPNLLKQEIDLARELKEFGEEEYEILKLQVEAVHKGIKLDNDKIKAYVKEKQLLKEINKEIQAENAAKNTLSKILDDTENKRSELKGNKDSRRLTELQNQFPRY